MESGKLLGLLKTFDATQWNRFIAFVGSPYFNKKEVLDRLARYLRHKLLKTKGVQLQKKAVHSELFTGQPYDDKAIRYLLSELLKLAEEFLVVENKRQDSVGYQLDLVDCFQERGLHKHYQQAIKKAKSALEKESTKGVHFYQQALRLAETEETYFTAQRIRKFDQSIQEASDYLDAFYYFKKLRVCCGMLDRQLLLQASYQLNLTDELLLHIEANNFFQQDLIRYYYLVLLALRDEQNESYFYELKKVLEEVNPDIPPVPLQEIYIFGINYCARKIRQGKEQFVQEALDLYLKGIERKVLLDKEELSPWTFTNVVKLALRLKQYDWIEGFIPQYAPMLPEPFRVNALHYNLAELFYYTKDYDRAQENLMQVQLSDLNYHVGSRVMLAKIYYETKEENALLSLLASFSVFLKRNKQISQELKRTYLNFCDLLYQILKRKPKIIEGLPERIGQTQFLTDRTWLLQVCKTEIEKLATPG